MSYKIAVNAGHHPDLDPGALGKYSAEADICKQVAHALCYELEEAGFEPIFIQENELYDICEIANEQEADLFISIHCNAFNEEAHGTETFYYEYADESYVLASFVNKALVELLGTTDRGIKDGSWLAVVNGTNMPAILTELAFIDNPREEDLLNQNIDEIAKVILEAICKYREAEEG